MNFATKQGLEDEVDIMDTTLFYFIGSHYHKRLIDQIKEEWLAWKPLGGGVSCYLGEEKPLTWLVWPGLAPASRQA